MKIKKTMGENLFDFAVYAILIALSAITIIPFLQVITISVSPPDVASKYGFHIFPTKLNFDGYMKVFHHFLIWKAYSNTIVRTALGTSITVVLLILGAYPLSKRYLPHRSFWTGAIVFTMYFQGGLIPSYLLVKGLGLYNSVWALVLPPAVSAFTLIIVRNFFMSIPAEIEESAKIDGANDIVTLFRIVVPLSMPIIATVTLWSVVYHWNEWFNCMIYIKEENKFVLQYVLRLILIDGQEITTTEANANYVNTDTMKMATLVVATLPIICVYPFLQKYFVKGVLVGSVKG